MYKYRRKKPPEEVAFLLLYVIWEKSDIIIGI